MEEGMGDQPEADEIRDKMDGPWGWHGGSHKSDLSQSEKDLLKQVSAALYGDKNE